MFETKVECSRCHRIWLLPQGQSEIECICHLYCTQGENPSDCPSYTYPYNFSGQYSWPFGSDQDETDKGHDRIHATGYCNTHNEYVYKVPIILEVDLDKWFQKRAPEKFRMLNQNR